MQVKENQKEGRRKTEQKKMEKVEWEEELYSKMDKVSFSSTRMPSLCIYHRFSVAFVLSLSINCAKSLCKES